MRLLQRRWRSREGALAPARQVRPGESFGRWCGLRGSFSAAVVAAKVLLLTAYLLQARPLQVRKNTHRRGCKMAGRLVLRDKIRDGAAALGNTLLSTTTMRRRGRHSAKAPLEDDFGMARRLQKEALGLRSRRRRKLSLFSDEVQMQLLHVYYTTPSRFTSGGEPHPATRPAAKTCTLLNSTSRSPPQTPATSASTSKSQSIPPSTPYRSTNHSFAFRKCPHSKNPLYALSGLGCTLFNTKWRLPLTFAHRCCAGEPQARNTTPRVRLAATVSMTFCVKRSQPRLLWLFASCARTVRQVFRSKTPRSAQGVRRPPLRGGGLKSG